MRRVLTLCLIGVTAAVAAQEPPNRKQEFPEFIWAQGVALHANDHVPESLEQWHQQRSALRKNLEAAWGGFPKEPCDLAPQKLGELQRDGYRIEKIIFQTRPNVWMTANAYVPAKTGKLPAMLCVHGHWQGAKQDPVVQSRCIGFVKHGFFVLVVDAFGAGERGVGKALGEYHGDMTGATLLPLGLPLPGLQVYENMRAVDYLQSRPEVDPDLIGITGASGGGNQSMYAGGWDERFKAVAPVCSVGTYQSYLRAACCVCELVPGGVRFTEEWGLLGLSAPRGLLIINATQDAPQFSVGEAKKSLASTEVIFGLHDRRDHLRHAIFESPHAYNRPMREAVYGWMKLHLAHEGDGSPLTEPEFVTEDPETLRCYPGQSRPDDFTTIPKFAQREGLKLVKSWKQPASPNDWKSNAAKLKGILQEKVFGGDPAATNLAAHVLPATDETVRTFEFTPEVGLTLTARQEPNSGNRLAIMLDLDGGENATAHPVSKALRHDDWTVLTVDLRATGQLGNPTDKIGRAPDHNSAEWAIWIGRPLLGQWVVDVRRTLDAIKEIDGKLPAEIAVVGIGPAGIVALCAATLDDRIQRVAAIKTLGSYVTDVPYQGQRLGIMAPGILRDVGDIPHIAALAAPRRLVLGGGVAAGGGPIGADSIRAAYDPANKIWELLGAGKELRFVDPEDAAAVVEALR